MSTSVDVLSDVELLPRRDRGRPLDELDGVGGRLVPHVVGHRGPDHRFHLSQNVAKVLGQKHIRMGKG